jgi:hypothetical protein
MESSQRFKGYTVKTERPMRGGFLGIGLLSTQARGLISPSVAFNQNNDKEMVIIAVLYSF